MPATTDFWVNDVNAEPLFFVTAPGNDGLLSMLDREVLPSIRRLVGKERRVTLVFDREGWSPKRFRQWDDDGFDVLTYRKGKYDSWPEECFTEVRLQVAGRAVSYDLAEQTIEPLKGFRMREVRRLCEGGHQTSVVTTRRDIAMAEVALRMFARWQQENFFRYMRQEFDLDHLPTTAILLPDPEREVPNPLRKRKEKELRSAKTKLAKANSAYMKEIFGESSRRSAARDAEVRENLAAELEALKSRCAELKEDLGGIPKRIHIKDLAAGDQTIELETERKVITDAVKMVAYRAESQLANLVGPLLNGRGDEARKFLKDVFQQRADLIPDDKAATLTVSFHSMSNWRSNRALAEVCSVLNDQRTRFPGTKLVLVFLIKNDD